MFIANVHLSRPPDYHNWTMALLVDIEVAQNFIKLKPTSTLMPSDILLHFLGLTAIQAHVTDHATRVLIDSARSTRKRIRS